MCWNKGSPLHKNLNAFYIKKYYSLLWSIIVENQFYKLIGNDLQLNTKLCYNELNITAIF